MVSSLLLLRAHVECAVRYLVARNERRDFTPKDSNRVNREIAALSYSVYSNVLGTSRATERPFAPGGTARIY